MAHAKGMDTYHGQEKDREMWQRSIAYRTTLINKAKSLGIRLKNPHRMKIVDIEALLIEKRRNENQN